eukprot:2474984-Rhodomonas_salina.2
MARAVCDAGARALPAPPRPAGSIPLWSYALATNLRMMLRLQVYEGPGENIPPVVVLEVVQTLWCYVSATAYPVLKSVMVLRACYSVSGTDI